MQDHVRMMMKIPPKNSVASVIGYIKGKNVIAVEDSLEEGKEILMTKKFWFEVLKSKNRFNY